MRTIDRRRPVPDSLRGSRTQRISFLGLAVVAVPLAATALAASGQSVNPGLLVGGTTLLSVLVVARLATAQRDLERANEELRSAARLRDDFLALASHELRTPLTPLRGFVEVLRAGQPLPAEQRQRILEVLDRQARRLERLVDDLLILSHAVAGRWRSDPRTVDLVPTLRQVAGRFDAAVDVVTKGQVVAWVDPRDLEHIVKNLVTNATTYGAPPVEIAATAGHEDVVVRVSDRGPGVAAELEARLFEAFAQGDTGDRRTSRGMGLGLAVCHRLARLNGADLWYEPRPGGGATFCLKLPASEDDAVTIQP